MKAINTYLVFDGKCREAVEFYKKCMGAELSLMPWSEAPSELGITAADAKDRVMHATLTKGFTILMAADTLPGHAYQPGNNFSVCIECESSAEEESLFAALGEGGTVRMPLQDMFWGSRFGTLTDRFGINWMFSFALPK